MRDHHVAHGLQDTLSVRALWALALAAAACAACIALGNWQARRADEKRALRPRSEKRIVACAASSCRERTVLLDNKVRHGIAPATRW